MAATAPVYVRWFADIGLQDRISVGGKGGSLGELTRAGIPVPPGFVVATAAFERFLKALDGARSIRAAVAALKPDDLAGLDAAAAEIRDRIERAPLPAEIADAVGAALTRLQGGGDAPPMAIRSSATSEDSADASFAGLQDTYLWMRGEAQVLDSLRRCWASLYSVPSVSYRRRAGLAEDQVAMGVVIQRMVEARCSGVMFTRSPTTGDRSVIAIEGSYGLGSCIVSGEVTPDKFVVSKVTGDIVRRDISPKTVQHAPEPANGGVRAEAVPAELQTAPCLTDGEIAALAETARRVERHYGCAQDIEWAIDRHAAANAGLYLLQSRPETVWANKDLRLIAAPTANPLDHLLATLGGRR